MLKIKQKEIKVIQYLYIFNINFPQLPAAHNNNKRFFFRFSA